MKVMAVNVGSSSLKVSLVNHDERVEDRKDADNGDSASDLLTACIDEWAPDVIAHRVVHGGATFDDHAVIDDSVMEDIAALAPLAPTHQHPALNVIGMTRTHAPNTPHVACFDTVYHRTIAAAAYTYALPAQWREWGARRYGFHGLSHSWTARQIRSKLPTFAPSRRVVSCHLGSGASLCAIADGQSVDTTMGMTPLEGLVMGSRPGTFDPAIVPWLISEHGLSAEQITAGLDTQSGLTGLSGSSDVAQLLERSDASARLAVDVYIHRLVAGIAAMTASLGGVDVLTFTGGVGENVPLVRRLACERLAHLGVEVDDQLNSTDELFQINTEASATTVAVIPAREDIQMSMAALAVVDGTTKAS